ncbi:MAG: SwmB domain-containing protein [Rhodoferax sp.]|nr:SwmB domain-containing protein [Rhodoferax sp.]
MTYTAKTETGSTWASRIDNVTLRNWSASQLYDFSQILPNSYFSYGRWMNGMDFTRIKNSKDDDSLDADRSTVANDGHQSTMFQQYHATQSSTIEKDDWSFEVETYTIYTDLWGGLDPAAVTTTSDNSYFYANRSSGDGFYDFTTWTSSSSSGDPYPTVTAKLNTNMKHLRAGMFSMLSASQISQISQPWAIPLNYWTGQYYSGFNANAPVSFAKKTRIDFNFNYVFQQTIHNSTWNDYLAWHYYTGTGGRFYMDDIFDYGVSTTAGTAVTSLPNSTSGGSALTNGYSVPITYKEYSLASGIDAYQLCTFNPEVQYPVGDTKYSVNFSSAGSTGFASSFKNGLRSVDKVAITGIAPANWAYLGSWLDSSGNYLNIGERTLASGGIDSSPWAYNFFQYFASTDGNIDDNAGTSVIRFLTAQQISYIGTKTGTTSWVSANSVYVKASGWSEVGVTFLGNLSGTQLSLVSNLETFSNAELAALAPWQVNSGFTGQDWSSLSGAQLNQISVNTSDASKNTFAYLPTAAYKGFSLAALRLLDANRVAQIPLRAFDVMSADQLNALGSKLGAVASAGMAGHLTNSKISQLGSSFFNSLSNGDFLNALTITQLGQIPSATIGHLSNAAVAGLNATTLVRLSDAQLGAITNQQYLTRPNGLLLRTSTTGIDFAKLVTNPLVDWSRITYYFLNQISQANFNLLTAAVWRQIPVSVLGRLTLAQTQRLSETVLNALSDTQFGALKYVSQISTSLIKKVFTSSRVSGLRPYSFWSYVTATMFNALSCKAETINGVSYSNVVARIPVAAISQLPVSVFAGIDTAHLEAFTNSQLANLTPSQFAAIDASKFLPYTDADGVVHPSRILTQVSLNTFKALQPTQIRRLYEFLFNTVDNNAFANVTEAQATANKEAFATLLGRIMDGDDGREKWLGNAVSMLLELNWLDADVVANIDLEQIQSDRYMNINWGWMSAKFLNSISVDVFSALKSTNVVQINLTAMAGLDASHVAALTATQVGAVFATDGSQVAGLTAEQLSAMSSIDYLSAAAVAAITPAVLAASTFNLAQRSSNFLNALSAQQYAALTGAQLAQFNEQQLLTLPIDWSLMGADALNGLSSAQFRALASGAEPKILNFSPRAFAGLDATHWVDLAMSVNGLNTSQVIALRQQLLDGFLPAEAQTLQKTIGDDILQLQVLEIALVRLLATLNPVGEDQYATALSAVLTMRTQFSERWTTGNVALLLSQLQFNIQRGKNLQVDSAPSPYFYSDLFDRQINQLVMLPLQSQSDAAVQIGSQVATYLAFIQGAFEPKFLTPSYNGPDGFAETLDPATYEEHLLQALLRFEDNLGKAPYTLFSLEEISAIVSAAFDNAKHKITTTGVDWDSLSDGERYLLLGQAVESELLDKASTKVLTAAGQTSINSTLVDSAEMLTHLGTVMYLVQLANDPNNSIGSAVAELGLSDANRIQYLGKGVYAALQQVATDTKQSVRAVGENLEHYLSGLGVPSVRIVSQFSSFKTALKQSLGQQSLEALFTSGTTATLGNSSLTQDPVALFNSLQSRLGVDLKSVLMGNLGISAAEGRSLSVADLLARLKAHISPTQNDLNTLNAQVIDFSAAIANQQAIAWPLGNLGRVVWSLFVATTTYKRPPIQELAFKSTITVDAVDDILTFITPLLNESRNKNINIADDSSILVQIISEGPLVQDWALASDQAYIAGQPIAEKYQTVKYFIRSLYERNGVHVSNDQVDEMLGAAFVKRTWDLVGQSELAQTKVIPDGGYIDFNTALSDAINQATADVYGLGGETVAVFLENGDVVREFAVDSGWNNLRQADETLYLRLQSLLAQPSEARMGAVTKIATQNLKILLQSQSMLSPDTAVNGAPGAAAQLRDFFFKLNSLTPALTEQQGANLSYQPSLKELFFRSQSNILNPNSTLTGVDLPAPVKAVLLTALHDAASHGYFDGLTKAYFDENRVSHPAGFGIETPEVMYARLLRLIDPETFYSVAGMNFEADIPAPDGTIVHRTIGDLRVLERNADPTYTTDELARGKATAQEVIELTGSEEAAYKFLSKGRANNSVLQQKYTKQFIQDAFEEVYKGALESYLRSHPNPGPDVFDTMADGLIRLSNVNGIQNNPIPGDNDLHNVLIDGLKRDGYGTPGNKTFSRGLKLLASDYDPLNQNQLYRNGVATGFTKAVRNVLFGDVARKLDTLLDTYIADIAQDYTNTVAIARKANAAAAVDATDFFTSRLKVALNQSVRNAAINENFFEQCKAFGIISPDTNSDDVPLWEFRSKLHAASQGLTADQAELAYPPDSILNNSVQRARTLVKATATVSATETVAPPPRKFHLAILGGNSAEITPTQRTQAHKVLALFNAGDQLNLEAAAFVIYGGGASVDDPNVLELARVTRLEQERLALNGQRVRGNSARFAEPEIDTVNDPIGRGIQASVESDYADPADLLRRAAAKAADSGDDVYAEPVVIPLKPATPALLKRLAIDLVRISMRDRVTLTPEELTASIKSMAKQVRISLANGDADIETISKAYYLKIEEITHSGLTAEERLSITQPLGDRPSAASGSSTLGVTDTSDYSTVFGASSSNPRSSYGPEPFGPNPSNKIVQGGDTVPDGPITNAQLQENAQIRRAVSQAQFSDQPPVTVKTRAVKVAVLVPSSVLSQDDVNEMMRLSLTTWLEDSYANRATHVDEYLRSKNLRPLPDYVNAVAESLDGSLSRMFDVLIRPNTENLSEKNFQALREIGFELTDSGWKASPGVDWDKVVDVLYKPFAEGGDSPINVAYHKKMMTLLAKLVTPDSELFPDKHTAIGVLTRRMIENIDHYSGKSNEVFDTTTVPSGDRSLLGSTPIDTQQLQNLTTTLTDADLIEPAYQTANQALGIDPPPSRATSASSTLPGVAGIDNPVDNPVDNPAVVGGSYSKLRAAVKSFFSRIRNAIAGGAGAETPAQVQADVANQVVQIYAVVGNKNQPAWMDIESQKFRLTAQQMAEAYKSGDGRLASGQGNTALRETIVRYLNDEFGNDAFGNARLIDEGLVDAYFKAVSNELGEHFLAIDAPDAPVTFNITELGGSALDGMLYIGTSVAGNLPKTMVNKIILELSLLLQNSVPATNTDGTPVPVYDYMSEFIDLAEDMRIGPTMTVDQALDALGTIADNLDTQLPNGKLKLKALFTSLKELTTAPNGTPDTSPEGQHRAQLKVMQAFKELNTEINTKLSASSLTPEQAQKRQQINQLMDDLSNGLSTATPGQVVNDADNPPPLPSRAIIDAEDFAQVSIAANATGNQGTQAVDTPDVLPPHQQTLGGGAGIADDTAVHLPKQSDNPSFRNVPGEDGTNTPLPNQGGAAPVAQTDEPVRSSLSSGDVIEVEVLAPAPDVPAVSTANGVDPILPPRDGTGGTSLLVVEDGAPPLPPRNSVNTVLGTAQGELTTKVNSAPTPATKALQLSRWARINNYLQASPVFNMVMNVTNVVMGVLGFLLSVAGMGMAIYGMVSAIRNRDKMNAGQFATAMVMGAAGILNSAIGLLGITAGAVVLIATKAALTAVVTAAESAGKALGIIGAGLGVAVSLASLGLSIHAFVGTTGDERDVAIANIAFAATQATIAVVGLVVTLTVCAAAGPIGWVVGIVIALVALLIPNFGAIVQAEQLVDKGTKVRNQQLWGQLWSLRCYYDVAYLSSLPTAQLGAAGYVDYLTGLYAPYMSKTWFDFESMLEQEYAFLGDSSFVLRMDGVARSINYKEISSASSIGSVHQTLTHAYSLMVTQQDLEFFDKTEYTNTVRQAYITDYSPAPVRNPMLYMASVDGNTLTLNFDRQMGGLDEMLPLKEQFTVKIGGSVVTISSLVVNGNGDVVLTLARAALASESVTFSYTAPGGSNITHALQDPAGYRSSSYTDHAVLNMQASSQAAPQLVDAYFTATYVRLVFDQMIDADGSEISVGSFFIKAYLDTYIESSSNEYLYVPVDVDAVAIRGNIVELQLSKLTNGNITVLRSNYSKWPSNGLPLDVRYSPPGSHAIKSVSSNGGVAVAGFTISNHSTGANAVANAGTSVVLVNQAASFGITRSGYVSGYGTDHSITMAGLPAGKLTFDHNFDWTDSWFTNSVTDDLAGLQEKMTINGNSDQVYTLESQANESQKTRYLHKSNAVGELTYLSVSAAKLAKDTFYLNARGSLGQNTISLDTKGTTALGGWGGNTFSFGRNIASSLYASVQNPGMESNNVVNISGSHLDTSTTIDLDHLVRSRYLLPRASFRVYGSADGRDKVIGTSDYQTYYATGETSDIELWGESSQVSVGSDTTTKLHGSNAQVLLDLAQWYLFGKSPAQATAQDIGTIQGNYGGSSVINLSSTNFGAGLDGHVNFSNSVSSLPDTSAFAVRVNASEPGAGQQTSSFGTSVGVKSVRVSGNSVILTLNQAVGSGQWVGLSYTRPSGSSNIIQDLSGNAAVNLSFSTSAGQGSGSSSVDKLINRTGADLKPAIVQASVNGNTVTLRFDETMQSNAALLPDTSAFVVKVNGVDVKVTALSVVDRRVLLTLASNTVSGDLVDVGYSDFNDTLDDDVGVLQSRNTGLDVSSVAVRAYNVLTSTNAPTLLDSSINGALMALSFSDRLDITRIPPDSNSDYVVTVNNQTVSIKNVLVNNNGVLVTLNSPVVQGAVVRISYTPGSHDGTLRGLSNRAVAAWSAMQVFNQTGTDSTPPLLQGAELAGATVTLTFSENLDITAAHRPDQSVFTVDVNGTVVPISAVSYTSNQIRLTLNSSVEGGKLVRVAYTPSDNQPRLRDLAGLELARFSGLSVRNLSRDVSPPTITSAVINGNFLTITFSEFLDLTKLPALENLHVRLGTQEVALVNSNLKDNVLTLSLGIAALPDAVVTFSYTRTPNSENNFQDSSTNHVATVSNLAVVNITGKDIDPPTLIDAKVSGTKLVLTLSENLVTDAANLPGPSSFTVQVNGTAVLLASSSPLSFSKNTITLTMATAVTPDDKVTFSYSVPPLQNQGLFDLSGNAARSFNGSASNKTLLAAPTMQSMAVDGYNLLINYDQSMDSTKGGLPDADAFHVEVRNTPTGVGTVVKVNSVVAYNKSVMLVLADPIARDKTVFLRYTKPVLNTSNADVVANNGFIRNQDSVEADSIPLTVVINLTDTAQLQTVKVNSNDLSFVLSQPLSLLDTDLPLLSSFAVTVDGKTVTPTAITLNPFGGTLTLPTAVKQGQIVTLAYTNNSSIQNNTETHRLRDFFGYEVGSFEAQTAINTTPAAGSVRPNLVQSVVDGDQIILTYDKELTPAQSLMQMHFAVAGAVDANGNPLKTGKVNAKGFLNFLGSNTDGDTYDLGDQSQVEASKRLVYLQLGSGKNNVVTYRDTTGMVLSPSSTGNALINVMPNAALTLYSTLDQGENLRPIIKTKADEVVLYTGSSLQGVLNGKESIDAREPSSTVSAELGVGEHKFQFGGQSYGMVINRVNSKTTIKSPLTPYDTQQGQLLEFKQSTTSEIYMGREADGTLVLDLHMLDSSNQEHDAWVYYDGGTSNLRLNAYDPNDGTRKYMLNIDKLVETLGTVGFSNDSVASNNKRRITDASSLTGQYMTLYRITDVVKYNLAHSA